MQFFTIKLTRNHHILSRARKNNFTCNVRWEDNRSDGGLWSQCCRYGVRNVDRKQAWTKTRMNKIALHWPACFCCRRLLFGLCVVIQAARWDESTATSSSNYFAVKHGRFSSCPSGESYPRVTRCVAVSRCLSERIVDLEWRIICLYFRLCTAPSRPVVISHIAAAVWIPSGSGGVIPENTARGVCVCVFETVNVCVSYSPTSTPTFNPLFSDRLIGGGGGGGAMGEINPPKLLSHPNMRLWEIHRE